MTSTCSGGREPAQTLPRRWILMKDSLEGRQGKRLQTGSLRTLLLWKSLEAGDPLGLGLLLWVLVMVSASQEASQSI